MIGKEIRLRRLFNGDLNNKIIVCAIDHGMFHGVSPGLENVEKVLEAVSGVDAILMAPGMIEHFKNFFFKKDGPLLISRLNFNSSLCSPWRYKKGFTSNVFSPSYLQSLGVDAVIASLQLRTSSEEIDTKNVELWGKLVEEKERIGLPLIGEFIPEPLPILEDVKNNLIKTGCRMICELGADAIKTFFTEDFYKITEAVPIPIFVLGAERLSTDADAINLATNAIANGASGIVFGRNIFQSEDPAKMVSKLKKALESPEPAEIW